MLTKFCLVMFGMLMGAIIADTMTEMERVQMRNHFRAEMADIAKAARGE